jgi:hypothetical protein
MKPIYVLATYLALAVLATPIEAGPFVFILHAGLVLGVALSIGITPPSENQEVTRKHSIVLGIIALFAAVRLMPIMIWGAAGMGADTGAYYRNFNACFASFAACVHEPIALFAYPLYALGIKTEITIIITHIAASGLLMAGVWRIASGLWGVRAGLWSIAVYALSLSQFLFYWSFFLKMEVAIALSLFALDAYQRNQKRVIAYATLTGIFHPIPAAVLTAALLIQAGIKKEKRALYVALLAIGGCAIIKWNAIAEYIRYFILYISHDYSANQIDFFAGHFIGLPFYHTALMPFYLSFGLMGIAWSLREKNMKPVVWYGFISLFAVALNIVFHNRFIAIFDTICIVFSGRALLVFAEQQRTKAQKTIFFAGITAIATYTLFQSIRIEPIAEISETKELMALQNKFPGMPLFLNNTAYRQFAEGYSGHPVILAPFDAEPWKLLEIPSLIYNSSRSTPWHPEKNISVTEVSPHIFIYKTQL